MVIPIPNPSLGANLTAKMFSFDLPLSKRKFVAKVSASWYAAE